MKKKFWIKERHNPQLGTYYTACGQLNGTDAKRKEKTVYGTNIMHGFEREEDYKNRLVELRSEGKSVNE